MKIGVVGSGDVGKVLAKGFKEAGHDVIIGTRDAAKLAEFSSANGITVAGFKGTVAHADLVVLAVLGSAVEDVIKECGGDVAFAGKLVIDPTNPLDFSGGMPPKLFVGTTDSLGERIQKALPGAKVVKAFNSVGNVNMIHPKFPHGTPTHLIAGDDKDAKAKVTELLHQVGWKDVTDLGGMSSSRWLEALCLAWVMIYVGSGSGDHAFAVLRK